MVASLVQDEARLKKTRAAQVRDAFYLQPLVVLVVVRVVEV